MKEIKISESAALTLREQATVDAVNLILLDRMRKELQARIEKQREKAS